MLLETLAITVFIVLASGLGVVLRRRTQRAAIWSGGLIAAVALSASFLVFLVDKLAYSSTQLAFLVNIYLVVAAVGANVLASAISLNLSQSRPLFPISNQTADVSGNSSDTSLYAQGTFMNTPYVQVAAALAAASGSPALQARLESIGLQAAALPASPVHASALASRLVSAPAISDRVAPMLAVPAALTPTLPPVQLQAAAMQVWLDSAGSDLREVRNETRRRVDRSFYVSLGFGVLGGLAIFIGVGLAINQAIPIGIASGIGGAVSSIFSGVFSHLYRSESSQLRQLVSDLRRIEDARIGLLLADQIQDPEERDAALHKLIAQIKRGGTNT